MFNNTLPRCNVTTLMLAVRELYTSMITKPKAYFQKKVHVIPSLSLTFLVAYSWPGHLFPRSYLCGRVSQVLSRLCTPIRPCAIAANLPPLWIQPSAADGKRRMTVFQNDGQHATFSLYFAYVLVCIAQRSCQLALLLNCRSSLHTNHQEKTAFWINSLSPFFPYKWEVGYKDAFLDIRIECEYFINLEEESSRQPHGSN